METAAAIKGVRDDVNVDVDMDMNWLESRVSFSS